MREGLPRGWRYLKVDLFNNSTPEELERDRENLKLSVSIQRADSDTGEWHYFRAGMNSPRRHYKRGVDRTWDWTHYTNTLKIYDALRESEHTQRANISKLYRKGYAKRRHTVEGLSAVLVRDTEDQWTAIITYLNQRITVYLDRRKLSPTQRRKGVIASGFETQPDGYTRESAKDILG